MQLGTSARFVLLALASGVPFNGMFPVRAVGPRVSGGAPVAGTDTVFLVFCAHHFRDHGRCMAQRKAGGIPPKRQIRHGFVIMFSVAVLNLGANLLFTAHAWWALAPLRSFLLAGR